MAIGKGAELREIFFDREAQSCLQEKLGWVKVNQNVKLEGT